MSNPEATLELTVFTVGDLLCAVENSEVREISGMRFRTSSKIRSANG